MASMLKVIEDALSQNVFKYGAVLVVVSALVYAAFYHFGYASGKDRALKENSFHSEIKT